MGKTHIFICLHINCHLWTKRWVGTRHFTVYSFIFLNHIKYTFFERIVFSKWTGSGLEKSEAGDYCSFVISLVRLLDFENWTCISLIKNVKVQKWKKKKEQSQEQERRLWWWGVGRVCGEHFIYNLREQGWKAKVNLQKRFSKRKEILKLPPVNWAYTVAHPPQAAGTGPGGAEGVGEPPGAGRGLKTSAGWGAPLELTCRPSSPRACCS